jgi:hypothetical protein
VVDIGANVHVVAEMLPDGLELTSMNDYHKWDIFGSRIISYGRPTFLTEDDRKFINKIILGNFREGIDYDFYGILHFLNRNIKESANRFYCSEYIQRLVEMRGYSFIDEDRPDKITPYQIQTSKKVKLFNEKKQGLYEDL